MARPGAGSSSSGLPPPNPSKGKNREVKPKSVATEAWAILKSATVKITEADGLRGKLLASGMCSSRIVDN